MAIAKPPRVRSRRLLGLVLGLLIAGAGVAGFLILNRTNGGSTATQTTKVLVAATDLPARHQIAAADVRVEEIPVSSAPADALAYPAQAVDQYTSIDIAKGAPVTATDLQPQQPTVAAPVPPLAIKDGDVAIAIPDDAGKGVAGYVSPGDHIDIVVDTDGKGAMQYVFQDVPVLRVGSYGHASTGIADMLVVELPRRQAEEISSLIDGNTGTPAFIARYVLRPADQNGKGYLDSGPNQPWGTGHVPADGRVDPSFLDTAFPH